MQHAGSGLCRLIPLLCLFLCRLQRGPSCFPTRASTLRPCGFFWASMFLAPWVSDSYAAALLVILPLSYPSIPLTCLHTVEGGVSSVASFTLSSSPALSLLQGSCPRVRVCVVGYVSSFACVAPLSLSHLLPCSLFFSVFCFPSRPPPHTSRRAPLTSLHWKVSSTFLIGPAMWLLHGCVLLCLLAGNAIRRSY